jgi:glycosyltransferase involved in cell wall biosynthesis
MTTGGTEAPLVSIFMFVRNGAASLDRALRSIRGQTYRNIEFVVQDAASTDGTLNILRGYGAGLEVVSEPDSGPNEGLWRALNRCNGEFIGSCLADEELLPDAVERAVRSLQAHPAVAAITGDAIITDLAGNQTGFWKSGPFNLVDYLLCDYCPYFVSSFFRREALLEAGLKSSKWGTDCVEFELWCRLAAARHILYVPQTFAKYAAHAGQSSNKESDVAVHFAGRLEHIDALCRSGHLVGSDPLHRALFVWGHARVFINHALGVGRPETAKTLYRLTTEFLSRFPPVAVEPPPTVPTGLRDRLSAVLRGRPPAPEIPLPPPPTLSAKVAMYRQLAERYEVLDRLPEALDMWRAIAQLGGLIAGERIGYTPVENRSSSSTAQST